MLRLSSIRSSVSGSYTCEVHAESGELAKRTVPIEVHSKFHFSFLFSITFKTIANNFGTPAEPPKIMPFQFPEELEVGGSTQATCSLVSGDKPIQFIWHKDNLPIPSILKVRVSSGTIVSLALSSTFNLYLIYQQVEQKSMDFFSLLIIQDLTAAHTGEYTCKATNNYGSVSHSAYLMVKGISVSWTLFSCLFLLDGIAFIAVFIYRGSDVGMACSEYVSVGRSCFTSSLFI